MDSQGLAVSAGRPALLPSSQMPQSDSAKPVAVPGPVLSPLAQAASGKGLMTRAVGNLAALRQPIVPDSSTMQRLQSCVQHKYLELGLLLGLEPAFLLPLCEHERHYHEAWLKAVLDAPLSLTFAQLLRAVRCTLGDGSGVVYALEQQACQHKLDWNGQLFPDQLQLLMPNLLRLKGRIEEFGHHLGLDHRLVTLLQLDVWQMVGCETMSRAIACSPPCSLGQLIEQLKEWNYMHSVFIHELENWLKKHPHDRDRLLSELVEEPEFRKNLFMISPEWPLFGMEVALAPAPDKAERWQQQSACFQALTEKLSSVLSQAGRQGLLTRENLLLAHEGFCPYESCEIIGDLMAPCQPDQDYYPALPEQSLLWEQLLACHSRHKPLPVSLVFALFQRPLCNPDWVRRVLNLEPRFYYLEPATLPTWQRQFSHTLLEASDRGTLTLEAVVEIARGLELPAPGVPIAQTRSETPRSEPLQWRDITGLGRVDSMLGNYDLARVVTLLLGLSLCADAEDYSEAGPLWEHILLAIPQLQTGHLRQLFAQHPCLAGAVAGLPYGEQTPAPASSLAEVCPPAWEFSQLALKLRSMPELVQRWYSNGAGTKEVRTLPKYIQVLHYVLKNPAERERLLQEVNDDYPGTPVS